MKNIIFFCRHFTERGSEVAVYDYAKYNEEILGNKSYIVCFTQEIQNRTFYPIRISYDKFKDRFPIFEINDIREITNIINTYNIHFFYTLTHGCGGDIYNFYDKSIWQNCRTIKHCIFETNYEEGDFYISISNDLNVKYDTNIPVIPHIVELPKCSDNLRNELNLPQDAIILGRHGGSMTFDIPITHSAIIEFLNMNTNTYFLFMNTDKFYEHPRIIYLDRNIDVIYKTKFINTCDAMIHSSSLGETFGLAIAEFSINNKPIITCPCGVVEHIKILGDKAILYESKEELVDIFTNIKTIITSKKDWNAYAYYSPQNIMKLFNDFIFNKI